jgi:hypothetical protein
MKFKIQKGKVIEELNFPKNKYCFHGTALDDRGENSLKLLSQFCEVMIKVEYFPEEFEIHLNGKVLQIDDLEDVVKEFASTPIYLDATTLGFSEILLLCRNLNKTKLDFLYIEPQEYSRIKPVDILEKRNFELSNEIIGFKAIPGHSAILTDDTDHKVVFVLGFEASRVEKAFEDHQIINSRNCDLIFGFPAFKPGWEMDSFANHIDIIHDYNIRGEIKFGAATDPLATYSILRKICQSASDTTQIFVAPLGTKPMAIGCALFLAENPSVAVLYDHPQRKSGRSSKSSVLHLYEVEFTD